MVHNLFLISLFLALAAISWIDIRTRRIPDVISLPLVFLGLVYGYFIQHSFLVSFFGALAGYCFFFVVEKSFLMLRGYAGLGRGDAKLLAVGGAWCGVMALPEIILISSGTGLLAGIAVFLSGRKTPISKFQIPFGPFLAAGILYTALA